MASKGCPVHTHNYMDESQSNYAQCKKLVKNKPKRKKKAKQEQESLYDSVYAKLHAIWSAV